MSATTAHFVTSLAAITLLLLTLSTHGTRVVVTFRNASLNAEAVVPENTTVVKQYGRRLVLQLAEDRDSMEEWIQSELGGEGLVELVESDVLASAYETDSIVNYTSAYETDSIVNYASAPTALYSITTDWNLDESEPYGLHIRSIRSLTNGQGATISIIDSGIADVAKVIFGPVAGYDFISSSDYSNKPIQNRNPDFTDPGDQGPSCPTSSWHGTKVASIAMAIAPGAKLTVMRVLGQCGVGFSSDIADAVVWAAGGQINGLEKNMFPASVISLSLAGNNPCPTYLQSAVNQARSLGAVVIVAAGNAAQNVSMYFPANCYGVLAIGASTRDGTPASYSNWGSKLAFSAQGGDANNPIPVLGVANGKLTPALATGTSFSAPHVAGFLALQVSIDQRLDSVKLVPFATCGGDTCGKILSSNDPSSAKEAFLPPPNYEYSRHDIVNSSIAVASGNDCSVAQWRLCNSPTCWWGAGTCKYAHCEECADCPANNYCPGDNNYYPCPTCSGNRHVSGCNAYYSDCQILTGCQAHSKDITCVIDDCPANQYMTMSNYVCNTCNRCGSNEYALGCGGSSQGECKACLSTCGDTRYLSGCSGVNPGTCASCAECGGGYSFGDCTGVGLSDSHTCTACAAGKYGGGGTSRSCTDCGAGKFNPNTGSPTEASCQQCPSGKYNPDTGSGSLNSCQNCVAGKFNVDSGSISESSCTKCTVGKYSNTAGRNSICGECLTGTYIASEGQTECTQCSAGSYTPSTGQTICTLCNTGKFSIALGAVSDNTCTSCASGKFGPTQGKSSCDKCVPGKYGPSTDLTACTDCETGKYNEVSSLSSACPSCDVGKYNANTGASLQSACASCLAGSYGPSTGLSVCQLCSPGTYSGTAGVTTCSQCPVNTFITVNGSVVCQACIALTNCAVATESRCIADFGTKCVACDFIHACVYQSNTCFASGSTTTPSCWCNPGYELVNNKCSGCEAGKYKATNGTGLCSPITSPLICNKGEYLQLGTAFANSACVTCPPLPSNAIGGTSGCEWKCSAGFDNNAP